MKSSRLQVTNRQKMSEDQAESARFSESDREEKAGARVRYQAALHPEKFA
jgi:hypothetical protein